MRGLDWLICLIQIFFISSQRDDSVFATSLYDELEREGFSCWIDSKDIPGGASWPKAITAAIRQSHNFILIFSESTGTSEFVLNQLMLAKSSGLKIIVILTGNSDLSYKYDLYMDTAYFICAFEYKKIYTKKFLVPLN